MRPGSPAAAAAQESDRAWAAAVLAPLPKFSTLYYWTESIWWVDSGGKWKRRVVGRKRNRTSAEHTEGQQIEGFFRKTLGTLREPRVGNVSRSGEATDASIAVETPNRVGF
jgi:hypothetical protein